MYKIKIALAVLSVTLLAVACRKDNPATVTYSHSVVAPVLETNVINVQVSDDVSAELLAGIPDVFADMGVVRAVPMFRVGGEFEQRQRNAGLHKWYSLTFDSKVPDFAVTRASGMPECVEYWECPSRRKLESVKFNDPMLSEQWHLSDGGSVRNAWEYFNIGDKDVIVAVIDGGIDIGHPDLKDVVLPGGDNGSKCFVEGHEGYTIYPHGHGTHVAGIIGAVNNNGEGVCGIAGGDDGEGGVTLMSCQIFYPETDTTDSYGGFPAAIQWAADHGAVIANNSWSYDYASEAEAKAGGITKSDKDAIDYFIKYAGCDKDGNQLPDSPMKGGLVLFASGNDGWAYGWPAGYDAVMAVGAVDKDNARPKYSNYGDWVDICAPGGDMTDGERYGVLSTYYSSVGGHMYAYSEGTSMACPNVSGVAALIVSNFGGEGFTADSLWHLLIKGADAVSVSPDLKIGPLVNAFGSLVLGEELEVNLYPNPVIDVLNIRPKNEATMEVKIYTSAGTLIFTGSFSASRTNPARIDVSDCIPGVYNVTVRMGSEEYKKSFVKK